MKLQNICGLALLCLLISTTAWGQPIPKNTKTESSEPDKPPLDGLYEPKIMKEKRTLAWENVREADVFWEKRVWRIIDVREKMNQPFVYPESPFINIILDAAKNGEITIYNEISENFTSPMTKDEAASIGASVDSITYVDPVTFQETIKVVYNELNWEDIKRFRVKEVWYFDEETSVMKSRILGIAPLQEVYDDQGNFKYEKPMFWAYYPELRQVLAHKEAFNDYNDKTRMSWEDVFEMRFFSSYIYKRSNVKDYKIEHMYSGVDALLEADKIKNEIFDFDHDLWSN